MNKSIIRKLRRAAHLRFNIGRDNAIATAFNTGKLAAQLIPDWADSDYKDFGDYLYAHGLAYDSGRASDRIATMALTYYEVPSLAIWQRIGYHQTARAAQYSQEGCREVLMRNGVTILDLLTMI